MKMLRREIRQQKRKESLWKKEEEEELFAQGFLFLPFFLPSFRLCRTRMNTGGGGEGWGRKGEDKRGGGEKKGRKKAPLLHVERERGRKERPPPPFRAAAAAAVGRAVKDRSEKYEVEKDFLFTVGEGGGGGGRPLIRSGEA